MSNRIVARSPNGDRSFRLEKSCLTLGNHQSRELYVDHPEVAPKAATIDNRGSSLLLINNNKYAIFVGQNRVEPGSCTPWNPQEVVQLTKHVTLHLASAENSPSNSGNNPSKKVSSSESQKQAFHIGAIVACLLICGLMLIGEDAGNQGVAAYTFEGLIDEASVLLDVDAVQKDDVREVMNALQSAHVTEIRWQAQDPGRVVKAYQILLRTEALEHPAASLADYTPKVREYAVAKINRFWSGTAR